MDAAPPILPLGPILLARARAAIAAELGLSATPAADHPALHSPGASFVTLTHAGVLRGCIGHIDPTRALGIDVEQNAIAAAFRDPRFAAVSAGEWSEIELEVSLLGPVSYAPCPTEEDCLRQVTPFEDGVILSSGMRRATFLPQVWSQLPDPQIFITHLLRKAGLQVDVWPSDVLLGRYRVTCFREQP